MKSFVFDFNAWICETLTALLYDSLILLEVCFVSYSLILYKGFAGFYFSTHMVVNLCTSVAQLQRLLFFLCVCFFVFCCCFFPEVWVLADLNSKN